MTSHRVSRNLAGTFEQGSELLGFIEGDKIRGITEHLLASQKKIKSQFAWIAVLTVSAPTEVNHNLACLSSKQN